MAQGVAKAGRLEDIPSVGNFLTYDILDDSAADRAHRSRPGSAPTTTCVPIAVADWWTRRRAPVTPAARRTQFVCAYHGWRFNLDGDNTHIIHKDDWQGALTDTCTGLRSVNVDTWGGWIWINLDPACEPLRDFLEPAATMLDPFELQNMRYRWRKWGIFDCNWKVALEAFNETYHVADHASGVQQIRRVSRLGQGARQAQQPRLRRAQGYG